MPLYDYECDKCGQDFDELRPISDRNTALCQCGGKGRLIIKRGKAPGIVVFQPGYWRDIGPNGTYVNNPQELRDALDRTGSRADFLENGLWRTSPGPDPIGVRGADPSVNNSAFDGSDER